MAKKLYVTEYARVARDRETSLGLPVEPPVAEQVVDFNAGVAPSSAFNASTRFIRIHADDICSVLVGAAPVATTASARLAQNGERLLAVTPGQKISAISNT